MTDNTKTLYKFIRIVNQSERRFYGIYHGRGMHVGIAVTCDYSDDISELKLDLQDEGLRNIARTTLHSDNLGRGLIYSWPLEAFGLTEEEASNLIEEAVGDSLDI